MISFDDGDDFSKSSPQQKQPSPTLSQQPNKPTFQPAVAYDSMSSLFNVNKDNISNAISSFDTSKGFIKPSDVRNVNLEQTDLQSLQSISYDKLDYTNPDYRSNGVVGDAFTRYFGSNDGRKNLENQLKSGKLDDEAYVALKYAEANPQVLTMASQLKGDDAKAWDITGRDRSMFAASMLASIGYSDVSQLKLSDDGKSLVKPDGTLHHLKDGTVIGQSSSGEGAVKFHAFQTPQGVAVVPQWFETSDKSKIATLASVAMMFVPGAQTFAANLGGAVLGAGAGGLASAAVGNAIVSGTITAIGGGDIEDILKSSALAGVATFASPVAQGAGKAAGSAASSAGLGASASQAVSSAVSSGVKTLAQNAMSGDISMENIIASTLSGGIGSGLNSSLSQSLGTDFGNAISKLAADVAGSVARGVDFNEALEKSVTSAGISIAGNLFESAYQNFTSDFNFEEEKSLFSLASDSPAGLSVPKGFDFYPGGQNVADNVDIDDLYMNEEFEGFNYSPVSSASGAGLQIPSTPSFSDDYSIAPSNMKPSGEGMVFEKFGEPDSYVTGTGSSVQKPLKKTEPQFETKFAAPSGFGGGNMDLSLDYLTADLKDLDTDSYDAYSVIKNNPFINKPMPETTQVKRGLGLRTLGQT